MTRQTNASRGYARARGDAEETAARLKDAEDLSLASEVLRLLRTREEKTMNNSTLTRVLSGLGDTAALLADLETRAAKHATHEGVLRYNEAYGYMVGGVRAYAEHLSEDIKLIRESLGGDTDGTAAG